jgi:tRNA(fMet)-specific endonuclease VapC
VVAAVTISELLFGLHRAQTGEQRSRRKLFIDTVTARLTILAYDLSVAEVHAIVMAELVTAGQRIGAHDVMIAATALTHRHAVLTENVREFSRVRGLIVQTPIW